MQSDGSWLETANSANGTQLEEFTSEPTSSKTYVPDESMALNLGVVEALVAQGEHALSAAERHIVLPGSALASLVRTQQV